MKIKLKKSLMILGAIVVGGVLGWVGNIVGITTPMIVAVIVAIMSSLTACLKPESID